MCGEDWQRPPPPGGPTLLNCLTGAQLMLRAYSDTLVTPVRPWGSGYQMRPPVPTRQQHMHTWWLVAANSSRYVVTHAACCSPCPWHSFTTVTALWQSALAGGCCRQASACSLTGLFWAWVHPDPKQSQVMKLDCFHDPPWRGGSASEGLAHCCATPRWAQCQPGCFHRPG